MLFSRVGLIAASRIQCVEGTECRLKDIKICSKESRRDLNADLELEGLKSSYLVIVSLLCYPNQPHEQGVCCSFSHQSKASLKPCEDAVESGHLQAED